MTMVVRIFLFIKEFKQKPRVTVSVDIYKLKCVRTRYFCFKLNAYWPVAPPGIFIGGGGQNMWGSGAEPQKIFL